MQACASGHPAEPTPAAEQPAWPQAPQGPASLPPTRAAPRRAAGAGSPLTRREEVLAGALAGIPVSLLATPTELLKCRLQAQAGKRPPPGKVYSLAEVQVGAGRGGHLVGRPWRW